MHNTSEQVASRTPMQRLDAYFYRPDKPDALVQVIANALGVSREAAATVVANETVNAGLLQALSEQYGLNAHWIVCGEGSRIRPNGGHGVEPGRITTLVLNTCKAGEECDDTEEELVARTRRMRSEFEQSPLNDVAKGLAQELVDLFVHHYCLQERVCMPRLREAMRA